MSAFRQRFFRKNSVNQVLPNFNNAKVSGFTVYSVIQTYKVRRNLHF